MFTTVTIGDICDERARELYLEEWRQPELTRISWCLAKSGQPDEWGDTYDLATWDKQSGTDLNGGSYWYKRTTRYSIFNHGPITSKVELIIRLTNVTCSGLFLILLLPRILVLSFVRITAMMDMMIAYLCSIIGRMLLLMRKQLTKRHI